MREDHTQQSHFKCRKGEKVSNLQSHTQMVKRNIVRSVQMPSSFRHVVTKKLSALFSHRAKSGEHHSKYTKNSESKIQHFDSRWWCHTIYNKSHWTKLFSAILKPILSPFWAHFWVHFSHFVCISAWDFVVVCEQILAHSFMCFHFTIRFIHILYYLPTL
jgi:hypothetical protein